MTFSTNCARCASLRLASAVVALLAALPASAVTPPSSARGGDIELAWAGVTRALDAGDLGVVRERCDALLQAAERYDLERLTPMALALVAKSRTLPSAEARSLLEQAARLDPASPEVWLATAQQHAARGRWGAFPAATGRAAVAFVRDDRLGHLAWPSAVLSLVVITVAVLGIWGLVAIRTALPRLWHDLLEMGESWRLGSNGAVLALLLLALPLFAGGDPLLLVLWVFALSWSYLPAGQKTVGVVALLLTALAPLLVEISYRTLTHPANPVQRAASALAERRYDPYVLDELNALTDLLGDDPDFRRLQGDCYRQYGLLDAAAIAYREGLRVTPRNGDLSLAIGTLNYLEGDYHAALAAFQSAREAGVDPQVAYFNLSLTHAQLYHFKESDEAMTLARNAGEGRLQQLTRGRAQEIVQPVVTPRQAAGLIARKDTVTLLNRGLLAPPLARERWLTHPLALTAFAALVLAIGVFLVREHTTGFAAACLKCGRAFCRRCKLSRESQSYCTQCVNIFLKKDMVAAEQQSAKRRQLRRYYFWQGIERRIADFVLPGLGLAGSGRTLTGVVFIALSALVAAVFLVWLPRFVGPALLHTPVSPLPLVGAVLWVALIVTAQLFEAERR
jgi:tetratricopeptide (TPR) repeat protein